MEPIVEWSVERGGKAEREGGREKKETKIHREQDRQIGVGMTTNTSGERREKYTRGRRETETHKCQEVLGSVVRYYGRGSPVHEGLTVLERS